MLKVVGASWLQTRVSTYILVAVALLGIGAIILSEFGGVNNDGTYSATVTWNHNKIYRIEFWGQGNDLESLPKGAARAYYKTRIHETGWSLVEIETSPMYPDTVQAYSAGMLEGSLTWQLIHHHWFNTIGIVCTGDLESTCDKIRQRLLENYETLKTKARLLETEDPFWHIIHLFYVQLEGLEEGWRFAVRRSRKSFDIPKADFLWLAMASDLPNFGVDHDDIKGKIFLKNVTNEDTDAESFFAIVHNTVAPYRKMLRLLKKYTFGYHETGAKNSKRLATRSVSISSYPGALSSQDEYYILYRENNKDLMILAGTSLNLQEANNMDNSNNSEREDTASNTKNLELDIAMTPAKIMAANWLSSDAHTWSRLLARREDPGNPWKPFQWVIVRPNNLSVWLVEQHPTATHVVEYTDRLKEEGYLFCDGNSLLVTSEENEGLIKVKQRGEFDKTMVNTSEIDDQLDMQEKSHEGILSPKNRSSSSHSKLLYDLPSLKQVMTFRGDFEEVPVAMGVIDSKIALVNNNGLQQFDATCGPAWSEEKAVFQWSESFPNIPHIGQPDKFDFESMTPLWIWF
ncbi:putative phospholipase B-like lamina ancestor isoform X2 [Chelonus insularis]|uniref:putative phospholipase B-like lamina ancestor isoform X2 n=1 Tax=Chelonus insularis TaxID=460826 RepID=UPI00158DD333|nr:putative phospholipase B-like lamina ancestor isoform X2 [Chelonus insularis]